MQIRNLLASDWEAVKLIYEKGIATGNATFQTSAPSWEEWDGSHLGTCRIVAQENGKVIGWAALTPVSSRWCMLEWLKSAYMLILSNLERESGFHF